jgi:endonuclease/exonuclease/phosphatase (EEP) superfamily protein YafD
MQPMEKEGEPLGEGEAKRKGEAPAEPSHQSEPPPPRPSLITRVVRAACAAYLLFVLTLWLLIAFDSDRWWIATAAMFGPVWVWALPLFVLLPLAALLRRKSLPTLAVAALVVLFPIARFCLPWRLALPARSTEGTQPIKLRVITLNADNGHVRPDDFKRLVANANPDLIVLQDNGGMDVPAVLGPQPKWHFRREGELALASRHAIVNVSIYTGPEHPQFWRQPGTLVDFQIDLAAPTPLHVLNVHLVTPRFGLAAVIERNWSNAAETLTQNSTMRREQSAAVLHTAQSLGGAVIIAGDFNTPTRGSLYSDHWSNWQNAFSVAGWGLGHTHFTRRTGLRIDHILVPQKGWRVERCWVGPDVGSAHRPVIADLVWLQPPH